MWLCWSALSLWASASRIGGFKNSSRFWNGLLEKALADTDEAEEGLWYHGQNLTSELVPCCPISLPGDLSEAQHFKIETLKELCSAVGLCLSLSITG